MQEDGNAKSYGAYSQDVLAIHLGSEGSKQKQAGDHP